MPIFVIAIVAILFSVFSAAVLAGHFFIYFSLKRFFAIDEQRKKKWLAVILSAMALSFGASTALAHFNENIVTRIFYFIAGLWLGLAMNLDMALGLAWLGVFLGKLFRKKLNFRILGLVVITVAFVFSVYGVVNAYSPRIKEITVPVKNLPAAWQGKRAVQISDVHLGHVFGRNFLKTAVNKINEINPDVIFITGDLLDGMDGNMANYLEPINNLSAPEGIYFVTGNHETYLGIERTYYAMTSVPKMKILKDEVINLDGLQILGVSFPEQSEIRDLREVVGSVPKFNPEEPAILLYHSPYGAMEAKEAGVDLMLAGHTHDGQVFPFGILTKMIFHGLDYGLYRDGDFSLYTSSGLGTWGPTMRTFSRPEIAVITLDSY